MGGEITDSRSVPSVGGVGVEKGYRNTFLFGPFFFPSRCDLHGVFFHALCMSHAQVILNTATRLKHVIIRKVVPLLGFWSVSGKPTSDLPCSKWVLKTWRLQLRCAYGNQGRTLIQILGEALLFNTKRRVAIFNSRILFERVTYIIKVIKLYKVNPDISMLFSGEKRKKWDSRGRREGGGTTAITKTYPHGTLVAGMHLFWLHYWDVKKKKKKKKENKIERNRSNIYSPRNPTVTYHFSDLQEVYSCNCKIHIKCQLQLSDSHKMSVAISPHPR